MTDIDTSDPIKANLLAYLQRAREALLWKLDGLDEYSVRRPMTPSGTNLLGLVKHTASVETGYLGETFGRPFPDAMPWFDVEAEPDADMWATADESREQIVDFYRRVWAHSDETVAGLTLDSLGAVPWWPPERREVPLHRVMIHITTETHRHAGHADIVRESIDGAIGLNAISDNLSPRTAWQPYREQLEAVARAFR